jgi:hypothetical protein
LPGRQAFVLVKDRVSQGINLLSIIPSIDRFLRWAIGPGWQDRRHPDFWFGLILLIAISIRASMLMQPLDWLISGFINDDFFYYAGTAWNLAHGYGSSCDYGLTTHNGFHPLYMLLLLGAVSLGAGKITLIYLGCLILTLGLLVSMALSYRIGARLGDRRLALCAPLALAINSYYVWTSFHGFETALVIMFTLATVLACLERRPAWVIGVYLGLVALSRVDAGVLALPVAACLFMQGRRRGIFAVAAVSLLLVSPWIIWSWSNFGTPIPLSGSVKSDGFSPELIGPGAANFARALLFQAFGEDLSSRFSWLVSFLLGLGMLIWLGVRRHRLDWIVGYVVAAVILYSGFSTPHLVKQNERYLAPAIVLTTIMFFVHAPRRGFVVPLVLAVILIGVEQSSYRKMFAEAAGPRFPLLGKTSVPQVLDRITGPNDLVGCFDSGAISYFAERPVINLDGLVNSEIVERLDRRGGESLAAIYSRYLRDKGITIMVGGNFGWLRYFPDLATWEVLADPIPHEHPSGEIVFLRVPQAP